MKESTGVFIGVVIILLLLTGGFRAISLTNPSMQYSEVCKIRYGENWTFEYSETFGQTCAEIDFISLEYKERIKVNFESKQIIEQYCEDIPYFNFKRWNPQCEMFLYTVLGEQDES